MPISSFIGRAKEVSAAKRALDGARLVTITGPGGVGKTRLALYVAAARAPQLEDGVWFVDFSGVRDPDLVPHAMASALGLREEPEDLTRALIAHLRPRHLLLVLDNCEQVLEACASLTHPLLVACPTVSALATSREPLRIPGERVVNIGPLPVPASGQDQRRTIERCPSVRLFVQRAEATRPDFRLDAPAARTVGAICRRLEGIPLAIELAAARMHALSPEEILDNLEDRFRFLTKGSRSAVPRHQTLEAVLDWSYDLLSEPERCMFGQVAVCAATFSSESAAAVCQMAGTEAPEPEVLLEQLVAKSLLIAEHTAAGGRFRMLDTVRDYAWRKLDPEEQAALQALHAMHYAALAARAEPELFGGDQALWLERLDAEHENFSAVLWWSLARGDPAVALQVVGSLAMFWRLRGHWSAGRQWSERALREAEPADPALRAKAQWGLAVLAGLMGDLGTAVPAAEHALELFGELNDDAGASRALAVLGQMWLVQQPAKALKLAEQSNRLARQAGDPWALVESLAVAGQARVMTGRGRESGPLFDEALQVARAHGNQHGEARALLGAMSSANESKSARESWEQALQLARSLGDRYDEAEALMFLGKLSVAEGQLKRARQLLEECLTLAQEIGSPRLRARALGGLGRLALAEGHAGTATFLLDEAIAIARELSFKFILVRCLAGRGHAAASQGDHDAARQAWEEALAVAQGNVDRAGAAMMLLNLAVLARGDGDDEQAGVLLHECIQSAHALGLEAIVASAFAARGGLALDQGRLATAARLLGAASAHAEAFPVSIGAHYGRDVAATRDELDPETFEKAWAEGAAMSLDEAVAYAARGRGPRQERGTRGWGSLTKAERQVAELAVEGLTNVEMAERLFVSSRTVAHHLSHIYRKLGISSRRELAKVASRRQPSAGAKAGAGRP